MPKIRRSDRKRVTKALETACKGYQEALSACWREDLLPTAENFGAIHWETTAQRIALEAMSQAAQEHANAARDYHAVMGGVPFKYQPRIDHQGFLLAPGWGLTITRLIVTLLLLFAIQGLIFVGFN